MTQPTPFTRSYSYTNIFAANPTQVFPGNALDAEFNNVKTTTDQILQNLILTQNDDGTIKNGSIGPNQLSPSLQVGFLPPVVWQPNTNYAVSPAATVFNANKFYSCLISHTSGAVFATDLAAGKWILIADLTSIPVQTAVNVSIVPAGGIVTADVQDAMYGLDGRITSNQSQITGFTSAGITDATTLGKTLLTVASTDAANAALNAWSTGDVKLTIKTVADTGWLMMNDQTIGSVSSGASFASATAYSLYTLAWNNFADADAPVSSGRGASAAADWAANKTLTLCKTLGRALGISGSGSGLTARALGHVVGEETHLLATGEMPSHAHAITITEVAHAHTTGIDFSAAGGSAIASGASSGTVNASPSTSSVKTGLDTLINAATAAATTGGGGTHNNMQPTTFLNVMIKL